MAASAGGTAVGVRADDGAALAATARATSGGAVAGAVRRVEQVHETGAVAAVGSVGDVQAFVRALAAEADRRRLEGEPLSAAALASRAGDLAGEHGVNALLGAVTPDAEDALFLVDSAGGVTTDEFAAIGAGRGVALGVLEANAADSLPAARDLARAAIDAVGERSAADGEGGHLAVVTDRGVELAELD